MKKINVSPKFKSGIQELTKIGDKLNLENRAQKIKIDTFWLDFMKSHGVGNYEWSPEKKEFFKLEEEDLRKRIVSEGEEENKRKDVGFGPFPGKKTKQ